MIFEKYEVQQKIIIEHHDPQILSLKKKLEAKGVRVVFAECPILKDDDDTVVSMKSFKAPSNNQKDIISVMFPVSVDPLTFETKSRFDELLATELQKLEKEIIDGNVSTFYFYSLDFSVAVNTSTDQFCMTILFRGHFK